MHPHIHIYTHTCPHTYTHVPTQTQHTHTHMCTHTYIHVYLHTCTHIQTHGTHIHMRSYICTRMRAHIHIHAHTQHTMSLFAGTEEWTELPGFLCAVATCHPQLQCPLAGCSTHKTKVSVSRRLIFDLRASQRKEFIDTALRPPHLRPARRAVVARAARKRSHGDPD